MRAVCVIGLGLIGGSILRAAPGGAWGATASETDAATAAAEGYDVLSLEAALARASEEDALVVLAVPLPSVDAVLRVIGELTPTALLTDVVSVKAPVAASVAKHAPHARYAGGHPMAGTAESGWSAGSAELFRGAPWVITTDEGTDMEAWRETAALALAVGAHVVPADAADHDAAVARVSHLPHILAAVLAATGADGGPLALSLAAGSFTDGTRVAATRPELTIAMCEANRSSLLAAVDDALGRLGAARGALASTGAVRATVLAGHEARTALTAAKDNGRAAVQVPLTLRDLRALGGRGGRVTALDGDTVRAELPVV